MYQSVRQKGTPILRPTPGSPTKTILPRHNGRIQNPQEPAVLNDPNHIQNPRRGQPLNKAIRPSHIQQQRPQISNQRPQQSHQKPVVYGSRSTSQYQSTQNPLSGPPQAPVAVGLPPGLDLIQLKQAGIDYRIVFEDGKIESMI